MLCKGGSLKIGPNYSPSMVAPIGRKLAVALRGKLLYITTQFQVMADRIIVAMTGATGQIYGLRALELLEDADVDSHLVLSEGAKITIPQENGLSVGDLRGLATEVHDVQNVGAPPASGSFLTDGMIVAPCSMKSLAAIAHGYADNLITRAADVTLKERRDLVLMPREKPFNRIHLKNMLEVTDAGGTIVPPFPSFYQNMSLEGMVTRTTARALSILGVEVEFSEWDGLEPGLASPE